MLSNFDEEIRNNYLINYYNKNYLCRKIDLN